MGRGPIYLCSFLNFLKCHKMSPKPQINGKVAIGVKEVSLSDTSTYSLMVPVATVGIWLTKQSFSQGIDHREVIARTSSNQQVKRAPFSQLQHNHFLLIGSSKPRTNLFSCNRRTCFLVMVRTSLTYSILPTCLIIPTAMESSQISEAM